MDKGVSFLERGKREVNSLFKKPEEKKPEEKKPEEAKK